MVQKGGNFNCNFQHSIDVFNSLNKVITRIKMNKNQHFTKPERLPGVINNPLRKTHSGMGNFWHAKKKPFAKEGPSFNISERRLFHRFQCRKIIHLQQLLLPSLLLLLEHLPLFLPLYFQFHQPLPPLLAP